MNKNFIKELVRAIQTAGQSKTSAYDTSATVTRVEGNTAWVHIPGGVTETPVKLTIAAKAGDTVQVRVSGGRAFLVGNATSPPTDDSVAYGATRTAAHARATADEAKQTADTANETAANASRTAAEAHDTAMASVASDTLHYLATSASSGVTVNTPGWTLTIQTITDDKPYLWTYHTYTKASGALINTQPVIIGTYGKDGTSVTILGSYSTLAELQAAHPTGNARDAYMVGGDLYIWNGSAWEDVGQIQGPQGPQGATGPQGPQGETGPQGATGPQGTSVTKVQPQYYLSTSATSATGGSWSNTLTYVTGKYIWTRDLVYLSNNTTVASDAIYNSALTSACVNAETAMQIAEDTNQYFWHTSTGTDTGAHITEIPRDDFLEDPANGGGNLLARSNGVAIRDGLTELAGFLSNSFFVGIDSNTKISYDTTNGLMLGENVSLSPSGVFKMKYGTQGSGDYYEFSVDVAQRYMYMNAIGNIMRMGADGYESIIENGQYTVNAPDHAIVLQSYHAQSMSGNIAQLRLAYENGEASAELLASRINFDTSKLQVKGTQVDFPRLLGRADASGNSFTMPIARGAYLIVATSTVASLCGIWVVRLGNNVAFNLGGGSAITVTVSNNTTVTVKTTSGATNVSYIYLGYTN